MHITDLICAFLFVFSFFVLFFAKMVKNMWCNIRIWWKGNRQKNILIIKYDQLPLYQIYRFIKSAKNSKWPKFITQKCKVKPNFLRIFNFLLIFFRIFNVLLRTRSIDFFLLLFLNGPYMFTWNSHKTSQEQAINFRQIILNNKSKIIFISSVYYGKLK